MSILPRVLLTLFLVLLPGAAHARYFQTGNSFFEIKTRYFTIVYPASSRQSALRLASFADSEYERINGYLGCSTNENFTVTLTPDRMEANGLNRNVPYTQIFLHDYPAEPDSEIGNTKDYFRSLFVHELTHALSLNMRSALFDGLSRIFGNWTTPGLAMPWYMIEGITVSFESLDGFGRVNDPQIREELYQDCLEGKFKDPAQAAGAWDLYPWGTVYYHYGGLFNDHIQKRYGMEKYRELWKDMSGNFLLYFETSFQAVYGRSIRDEWADFRESIAREVENAGPVNINTARYPEAGTNVRLLAVQNRKAYYRDFIQSVLHEFDTATGDDRTLPLESCRTASFMSLRPDSSEALFSYTQIVDGIPMLFARVYDTEWWRPVGAEYEGIREAAFYLNNAIIAIRPRRHLTDIVRVTGTLVETLLEGREDTLFGSPQSLSDGRIAFLARVSGESRIGLLDPLNRRVEYVRFGQGQIRDLSARGSSLYFSWNPGRGWFKPARLDLTDAGNHWLTQSVNYSGGVFSPMENGDHLVCTGRFSDGDRLMSVPANFDVTNSYTLETDVTTAVVSNSPAAYPESGYFPAGWLLPHFWVPIADFGNSNWVDSAGFMTVLMDPLDENRIDLTFKWNWTKNFADWNLSWRNQSFPVTLGLNLSDHLDYVAWETNYPYRSLYGYAWAGWSAWLSGSPRQFTVTGNLQWFGLYEDLTNTAFANAYDYPLIFQSPGAGLRLSWTDARFGAGLYDHSGYDASVGVDWNFMRNLWKSECSVSLYHSFLPAVTRIYGAFSLSPVFNLASWNTNFPGNHYPSFSEYGWVYTNSRYYIASDSSLLLFNSEKQIGAGAIPAYLNRFYGLLGYRNAFLSAGYYHSVYARIQAETTWMYRAVNLNFYMEGCYRINIEDYTFNWGFWYNTII